MSVQIIMPTLNYGKWIRKAISSVVKQKYSDWSLYIMDGGSTDNTRDIVEGFEDTRINYVTYPGPGLKDRLNEAALVSNSKYISILAADDYLDPLFFDRIVAFSDDRDAMFTYAAYWDDLYVNEQLVASRQHPHVDYEPGRLMEQYYMGVFWLLRRELWEALNGMTIYDKETDPKVPFDYDFTLQAEEAGATFAYFPELLAHYRNHSGSDTGKHSKEWLWQVGERARELARKRRGLA